MVLYVFGKLIKFALIQLEQILYTNILSRNIIISISLKFLLFQVALHFSAISWHSYFPFNFAGCKNCYTEEHGTEIIAIFWGFYLSFVKKTNTFLHYTNNIRIFDRIVHSNTIKMKFEATRTWKKICELIFLSPNVKATKFVEKLVGNVYQLKLKNFSLEDCKKWKMLSVKMTNLSNFFETTSMNLWIKMTDLRVNPHDDDFYCNDLIASMPWNVHVKCIEFDTLIEIAMKTRSNTSQFTWQKKKRKISIWSEI